MLNQNTWFQSPHAHILSTVTAILANHLNPQSLEDVCCQLHTHAIGFIESSSEDALRYANNRVLWNKQPLFHAVLLEELSRREVDCKKKATLCCHAVYCFAKAGIVKRAIELVERVIAQSAHVELLTAEADKATNQAELPLFSAIVYEAKTRVIDAQGRDSLPLIELYQKATYFYAMAQRVAEAKQCAKKWLVATRDELHLYLYQEANDNTHYATNPLYTGVINELLGTHFLNKSTYGYGSSHDRRCDQAKLTSLYHRAMLSYDTARQIEPLKRLVGAFKFIDAGEHSMYKSLFSNGTFRTPHPLMAAVFHEVYENYNVAGACYREAGFFSKVEECEGNEKIKQQKKSEKEAQLVQASQDQSAQRIAF